MGQTFYMQYLFNLTTSQKAVYCWDPQFTDEETKTQAGQVTCSKSQVDYVELFIGMSGPAESISHV